MNIEDLRWQCFRFICMVENDVGWSLVERERMRMSTKMGWVL